MQSLIYNNKPIRVFEIHEGVTCFPWFCGRDICEILEYSNYRQSLYDNIEDENKKNLKDLGVHLRLTPTFTHNEGQMAYINETGLYSLINRSRMPRKEPFKAFLDQFFYDLRLQTKVQEHQMDMFDFIRTKNLPILADISKQWFKQIWLPLILKGTPLSQRNIQPPQLGGWK